MNRITTSVSALRVSVIVAVCALLAACADPSGILPHAHPTTIDQLNVSSGLSHQIKEESNASAAQAWWHAFHDRKLDAPMMQALTHNPDLAIARARIRQAEGLSQAADAEAQRAEQRFAAGLTNRLPVLTARQSVLNLEAQRISLNAEASAALAQLYAALGGTVLPHTLPHASQGVTG